jgi:hypothetical protein
MLIKELTEQAEADEEEADKMRSENKFKLDQQPGQ